jgi:hypothetical protein
MEEKKFIKIFNKGGQVAATAAGLANARPSHQRYEKQAKARAGKKITIRKT